MWFADAKELTALCKKQGMLHLTEAGEILVYHEAGEDPQQNPEGFYAYDEDSFIHLLMEDENGQQFLIAELEKRGIPFERRIQRTFDKAAALFPYPTIHFREIRPGVLYANPADALASETKDDEYQL